MKNLSVVFIVLISLFVSSNYFAQGKIMHGMYKIGGNVGFSSTSSENDYEKETSLSVSISPTFSYLLTNNLEVGGNLGYNYSESKYEPKNTQYGAHSYTYISRSYGIGPMVRYYFPAGSFFPFIGGSFRYYTNKLSGDNKSETRVYSVFIGAEFFISSSVAVEPLIQYSIANYGQQDHKGISVGVGINYFIVD